MQRHVVHKDERVRKACVIALIRNGNKGAQQALVDSFNNHDESLKKTIITFFGQIKSKIGLPVLADNLGNKQFLEQNRELAGEMIQAVGKIGAPASIDILLKIIQRSGVFGIFSKRDDDITIAVLNSLTFLGDPKGVSAAKKFVRDKNPRIAKAAQLACKTSNQV